MAWKAVYSGARFMRKEASIMMGRIEEKWYSGRKGSQGLNRVTGRAANAWRYKPGQSGETFSFRLVNNSGYAGMFHEKRTVKPKASKYLSIPLPSAQTKTGRPRYIGPRDPLLEGKTWLVRTKKGDGFVLMGKDLTGTDKDGSPLYVFKKEVNIPAYTGRMNPWIAAQADRLHKSLGENILESLNKQIRKAK